MSDYTGYNMPTGCSNMDIPGFDCSDEIPTCEFCGEELNEDGNCPHEEEDEDA